MSWLEAITNLMDMSLSKLWVILRNRGGLACCCLWGHKDAHDLVMEEKQFLV